MIKKIDKAISPALAVIEKHAIKTDTKFKTPIIEIPAETMVVLGKH